jgi:hypothetical protein
MLRAIAPPVNPGTDRSLPSSGCFTAPGAANRPRGVPLGVRSSGEPVRTTPKPKLRGRPRPTQLCISSQPPGCLAARVLPVFSGSPTCRFCQKPHTLKGQICRFILLGFTACANFAALPFWCAIPAGQSHGLHRLFIVHKGRDLEPSHDRPHLMGCKERRDFGYVPKICIDHVRGWRAAQRFNSGSRLRPGSRG